MQPRIASDIGEHRNRISGGSDSVLQRMQPFSNSDSGQPQEVCLFADNEALIRSFLPQEEVYQPIILESYDHEIKNYKKN